MMSNFYTIGYEGTTIDDFVQALLRRKIEVLADVRQLPLSRKPGFSKKALSERLHSCGIRYLHLPALGDPKEGRLAARAGKYSVFKAIYGRHMEGAEARGAISVLAEQIADNTVCLMCFEREAAECHRTLIAERLVRLVPADKVDLYVDESIARKSCHFDRPRTRTREGFAAA